MKKWWLLIKEIHSSSDTQYRIPPLEIGESIINDDLEKVSLFKDFFLEASTIDDSSAELPNDINISNVTLANIQVTVTDVIDQIECLNM